MTYDSQPLRRVLFWAAGLTIVLHPAFGNADAPCEAVTSGAILFVSPQSPRVGQALTIVAASEIRRPKATLVASLAQQSVKTWRAGVTEGGPPYWTLQRWTPSSSGTFTVTWRDQNDVTIVCLEVTVTARDAAATTVESFWPIKNAWSLAFENLYAAWIEYLFDAPTDEQVSIKPLHHVLRDPKKNFLYNYFAANEDGGPTARDAIVAQPDCADMPYFLRAYFAWKLRLPFAYRQCDRGSSKRPTRCGVIKPAVDEAVTLPLGRQFSQFLRKKVSYVHSATGRTAANDEQTDLYPVALDRQSLRPGVVYVDPYGHLLVIAKWIPQSKDRGGILFAVDGHPDLSVGRKRFWRGAFMFNTDFAGGAGGFKAFRPLRHAAGQISAVANADLTLANGYLPFSTKQYELRLDAYYDVMDRVITPKPLPLAQAYTERLQALYELFRERVDAVAAAELYRAQGVENQATIPMPDGPKIFETQGLWEDYSTPARDMRLLIAIDDVLHFAQRKTNDPSALAALKQLFEAYTKKQTITYTRSDGTAQLLTMADVIDRRSALEMAYNPNDCIEIRWGEPAHRQASCQRRAPADQVEKMALYRSWFTTRNRPPIR